DARVEAWLAARFGVSIDFEIDDGLAKLERFGLLVKKGERLCVPPVADALGALDRIWDGYFAFPEPPSQDARRRA
ncbi:MAG TPA: hypothetical protein VFK86_00305, partial [Bauldia sp.]|nr:hypothetical protein [Bauldia sp.]